MSAEVQFIERDGKREYAVVPIDTYRTLLEKAEMLEEIQDFDDAVRELEKGEDELIPGEVVERLVKGEPPLRVWREFRGFTQAQLAQRAGVSQGAVAQIESGKRRGSIALLRKLAVALDLDTDDLIWDEAT